MMDRVSDDDIRSAREKEPLAAVVARDVALKQRGRRYWGCCPFHAEKTPSFAVDARRNTYQCYGCGAHGDAITWRRHVTGESFAEAVRAINGDAPLPRAQVTRIEQERATREDEDRRRGLQSARSLWSRAMPIAGTPGAAYFRGRGITIPLPPSLRYLDRVLWGAWHRDDHENIYLPAVICAVQAPSGALTAVHRLYLDPSTLGGTPQKWPLAPNKALRGDVSGGAIRLYRREFQEARQDRREFQMARRERMGTAEGVETSLSVIQARDDFDAFWAGIDTEHLQQVVWPDDTVHLTVFADRDRPNMNRYLEFTRPDGSTWRKRNPLYGTAPGEVAARRTCAAFIERRRGNQAAIALPPGADKADFNDLLVTA